MDLTEAQIIDSVRKGEGQGYRDLVAHYGRQVQMVVAQMVEDADDADELLQDVFLKVIDSIDQFDPRRASLSTWISRIAYNVAANHLRRWRPRIVRLALEAIDALGAEEVDGRGEDEAAWDVRVELLDEAIGRLRPEERLLVHLRYYDGRLLSEIGYVMDVGEGALASRLRRIRIKLRRMITALEDERRD